MWRQEEKRVVRAEVGKNRGVTKYSSRLKYIKKYLMMMKKDESKTKQNKLN